MPKKPTDSIYARIKSLFVTHKKRISILLGVALGLICIGVAAYLSFVPIKLQYQAANQRVDQPIVIEIAQPVRDIDLRQVTVSPQIAGTWSQQTHGLMAHTLTYTPERELKTGTTYTVNLPAVQRLLVGGAPEQTIRLTTEKAPSLEQTGVLFQHTDVPLAADASIDVTLTSKNRELRDLVLKTTPEVAMTRSVRDDKVFSWKPTTLLPQGQQLSLEVYDKKNNESLLKKELKIAAEPHVTSPPQVGDMTPQSVLQVTFSEPIAETSKNDIAFAVDGEGVWKDTTTYEFRPTNITPGTTYNYTIKKGMRSQNGGVNTDDRVLSFSTVGALSVVGTSPRGASLKQDQQVISVTFNRAVDRASAESRLQLSSGTIANTSWSGNTLRATVKELGFQRRVTVTMLAGVKNVDFGLPSNQNYSFYFDTEARTIRLDVPHYTQQHTASCTAASLRMMLAYRGIQTDEMSLIYKMGYAPRDADHSTSPPTWDDPDEMFVGNVDATSSWNGAGPDAPPVAKAARAYRGATNFTGVSAEWIAARIHEGNPVMMFGATRSTGFLTWQTPTGRLVRMNISSHATVVSGVVGEPSAPIGFWVNDPRAGVSYWSVDKVRTNIARDAYAQAVVVY